MGGTVTNTSPNDARAALSLIDGGGSSPADKTYTPFATYPDMCTSRQAAQALNSNEKTVRQLIDSGELFAVRLGRVWRVPKQSLIDFSEGRPPRGRSE